MNRAKENSSSKTRKTPSLADQLKRFREMARELEADESPDALDRVFGQLDPKKKDAPKPPKGNEEDEIASDPGR